MWQYIKIASGDLIYCCHLDLYLSFFFKNGNPTYLCKNYISCSSYKEMEIQGQLYKNCAVFCFSQQKNYLEQESPCGRNWPGTFLPSEHLWVFRLWIIHILS